MQPALNQILVQVADQLDLAGHGERSRIYAAAAGQLGISVPTLLSRLRQVRAPAPRRRRSDAGAGALSRDDALMIAATIEETRRLTGVGTLTVEDAVSILRSNGRISAGRVDAETGEFCPLSLSAIRRGLARHGVHPEQLQQPTPATRLSSPHPNHCWQIDASVSRQFFLADAGTEVMDRSVYYRGKPANLAKINDRRLWRYAITDHYSGYIELFYVQGAESALNLIASLIHAMTDRQAGCMHGVPTYLMSDPGSAVTAQTTKNFCAALGIEIIVNQAGNARAKGQVENAHWLIERSFEAPLKLRAPVCSIAEMNGLAAEWAQSYNANRRHTRTGLTRRDAWLQITAEQLRVAPAVAVLRELPTSTPLACTIRDWRIRFRGRQYDLRGLPGALNGSKCDVVINPFDTDSVRVVSRGDDGRPQYFAAPCVQTSAGGFEAGAAQIGREFKGRPETSADAAKKEIERLAMGVDTDTAALAARRAKRLAFGGTVDPTKPAREAVVIPALPRHGTASTIAAPAIVASIMPMAQRLGDGDAPPEPWSLPAMARDLKRRIEARGGEWSAETYHRMAALWPDGVVEDQLEDCAVQLLRGGLRAVGGVAA